MYNAFMYIFKKCPANNHSRRPSLDGKCACMVYRYKLYHYNLIKTYFTLMFFHTTCYSYHFRKQKIIFHNVILRLNFKFVMTYNGIAT